MGDKNLNKGTAQSVACRRRGRRIAMPLEVQLETSGRMVPAVIRDVSFSTESDSAYIGIGIHHSEVMPLGVLVSCRLLSPTSALPKQSHVTLIWSRQFGDDGYLSGGRMVDDQLVSRCESES